MTVRRWLPTVAVLAACAALFTYLQWYDRPDPAGSGGAPPQFVKLVDLQQEDVTELAVTGAAYTARFVRQKQDDRAVWTLAAASSPVPAGQELDSTRVQGVVASAAPLFASRRVAAEARDPAEWGLDRPTWTLTLRTAGGQTVTLRIGAHQPVNSTYYAQREGDPAVYTVSASLVAALPEQFADWFRPKESPSGKPGP